MKLNKTHWVIASSALSIVVAHFFIGKESSLYIQTHTGIYRRAEVIGIPFWNVNSLVIYDRKNDQDSAYTSWLRGEGVSINKGDGQWILASRQLTGLIYGDKVKHTSASGFDVFPLPPISPSLLSRFFAYAKNKGTITKDMVIDSLDTEVNAPAREKLWLAFYTWMKDDMQLAGQSEIERFYNQNMVNQNSANPVDLTEKR